MGKNNKYVCILVKIILGLLISSSAFAQDSLCIVNGKIAEQFNDKPIMLFTFKNDTVYTVDTTIIRDKKFTFKHKEYLRDQSLIVTGNFPEKVLATYIILEAGVVTVNLDNVNSDPDIFIAYGTHLNDQMKAYTDTLLRIGEKWDSTQTKISKGLIAEGAIDSLLSSITQERYKMSADFKKRNINNLAGKVIFKRGLSHINDPSFEEIYNMAGEDLRADMEVIEYIKEREGARLIDERRVASIGHRYSNFELKGLQEPQKISNYIGKSDILIIDFWASWCGPCIAEFPHLKKIYEKYQKKGLSILSVSIDSSRANWINALSQHSLPWDQLLAEEKDHKKIMEAYNIRGIPYIVLLDNKGEIIATNLRGEELERKIKEVIAND
jgi:thiol-disulfide isomerase/thioredoxin